MFGPGLGTWPNYWVPAKTLYAPISRKGLGSTTSHHVDKGIHTNIDGLKWRGNFWGGFDKWVALNPRLKVIFKAYIKKYAISNQPFRILEVQIRGKEIYAEKRRYSKIHSLQIPRNKVNLSLSSLHYTEAYSKLKGHISVTSAKDQNNTRSS